MNRSELQQLAEDRILDAEAMLASGRWSGAYYLAGDSVELGLKSCVLAYVIRSGAAFLFQDKKFAEKCWTHDLENLVQLANLEQQLKKDMAANQVLRTNWSIVKDWVEISRYQQQSQIKAQTFVNAIPDQTNGVLPWIRGHW